MIGHSRILDPELRPLNAAWPVAQRLTVKAASRLRRAEHYATRFALSVRDIGGKRWAGEVRLTPTQDNFTLTRALQHQWQEMVETLQPLYLKKISVTLYGLCQQGEITLDLFATQSASHQRQLNRHQQLSSVIDAVNQKYGSEALHMGITPKTRAGYLGTKIAFNRVPEQQEFRE